MELLLVILCAISLIAIFACLVAIFSLSGKLKSLSESKDTEKKLDEMRESIYNEFSRNRTEQNRLGQAQREETARQIREIDKRLENLTETNREQLLQMYREMSSAIHTMREKNAEMNERQSRRISESLESIRVSNEKKLDEMRTVVDEKLTATLTQRLDSSFKTVSSQLENLYKALGEMKELSGGITENVTSLNRVLTNVKARGTWAEVQLGNILDQTIPGMYVENYAPTESSKERVEFAIKIPSGENYSETVYLPVDSKFPMEDYVRLCDAADRADRAGVESARKALEECIIREARSIRKYIAVPQTTPFAIMYLASEGLYAEVASSQSALPERLQT